MEKEVVQELLPEKRDLGPRINGRPFRRLNGKRAGQQEDSAVLESRLQIADMLVRGYSQPAIAEAVGISIWQVQSDVKYIRARWREKREELFDEWIGQELAKLDALEQELWAGFRQSQEQVVIEKHDGGEGFEVVESPGDIRFLDSILKVMDNRAKRLGLYAPEKKEFHVPETRTTIALPEGASYGDSLRAVAETLRKLRDENSEESRGTMVVYSDSNGDIYPEDEGVSESLDTV